MAGMQTVIRYVEICGVGDRRHLDRRFCSIKKRIEHLGVEIARGNLRFGEAVMAPNSCRCRLMIAWQVFCAFAGADDLKPRRARSVDHLGNERWLVAIGHGIENVCLGGTARQHRSRQHIGLDVHHHDVALMPEACERMLNSGGRIAGGLDDHVDAIPSNESVGVLGEERAAATQRVRQ
jgi:hypothetical protein